MVTGEAVIDGHAQGGPVRPVRRIVSPSDPVRHGDSFAVTLPAVSNSFPRSPDPTVPFPAVYQEGQTQWRAKSRLPGILGSGLTTLGFVALALFLAQDTEEYAVRYLDKAALPLWPVAALGALIAFLLVLWACRPRVAWAQDWSFVEALEEGDDLRIFVSRLGPDHPGALVRRGEVIELAANPGAHDNILRVWAGGQLLEVEIDVPVAGLTYDPLAIAAFDRDIAVTLTGAAQRIPAPDFHAAGLDRCPRCVQGVDGCETR